MEFNYENVLQMLVSKDEESRNTAMILLENIDFETYKFRIIFLKKEANIDVDVWNLVTTAIVPKMRKLFNQAGESIDRPITSNVIIELMRRVPAEEEDYLFCLNRLFTHFITQYLPHGVNAYKHKNIKFIKTDD